MGVMEILGAIITGLFALGLGFAVFLLLVQILIMLERLRKARIDAISWHEVPEGKVAIHDVRGGQISFQPFYEWPGEVEPDKTDVVYRVSKKPTNMYIRTNAIRIIEKSMDMYGHNGARLLGIGTIDKMTDQEWRAAREYLSDWEIETRQVGEPDPGTYVGNLHANLKDLHDNVVHHRVPVLTPPTQTD